MFCTKAYNRSFESILCLLLLFESPNSFFFSERSSPSVSEERKNLSTARPFLMLEGWNFHLRHIFIWRFQKSFKIFFYHPPAMIFTAKAENGQQKDNFVFLGGLGGWKIHQMSIFASRSKNHCQIDLFPPSTTQTTEAVMLGGKKLTLLFLGLGGWKFHQIAIFANR